MGRIVNPTEMMQGGAIYTATFNETGMWKTSTSDSTMRLMNSGLVDTVRCQWVGGIGGMFGSMLLVNFRWIGWANGGADLSCAEAGIVLASNLADSYGDWFTSFEFVQMQAGDPGSIPVIGAENTPTGGQPNLAPDFSGQLSQYLKYAAIIVGVLAFIQIGGVSLVRDTVKSATQK